MANKRVIIIERKIPIKSLDFKEGLSYFYDKEIVINQKILTPENIDHFDFIKIHSSIAANAYQKKDEPNIVFVHFAISEAYELSKRSEKVITAIRFEDEREVGELIYELRRDEIKYFTNQIFK